MICVQTLQQSIPKFKLSKKQGIVMPWWANMEDIAHFCEDSLDIRVSDKMKITARPPKFDGIVEKSIDERVQLPPADWTSRLSPLKNPIPRWSDQAAIQGWVKLTSTSQLRLFLGLCNFYGAAIVSTISGPESLEENVSWTSSKFWRTRATHFWLCLPPSAQGPADSICEG